MDGRFFYFLTLLLNTTQFLYKLRFMFCEHKVKFFFQIKFCFFLFFCFIIKISLCCTTAKKVLFLFCFVFLIRKKKFKFFEQNFLIFEKFQKTPFVSIIILLILFFIFVKIEMML